jgi:hypothetical protein
VRMCGKQADRACLNHERYQGMKFYRPVRPCQITNRWTGGRWRPLAAWWLWGQWPLIKSPTGGGLWPPQAQHLVGDLLGSGSFSDSLGPQCDRWDSARPGSGHVELSLTTNGSITRICLPHTDEPLMTVYFKIPLLQQHVYVVGYTFAAARGKRAIFGQIGIRGGFCPNQHLAQTAAGEAAGIIAYCIEDCLLEWRQLRRGNLGHGKECADSSAGGCDCLPHYLILGQKGRSSSAEPVTLLYHSVSQFIAS